MADEQTSVRVAVRVRPQTPKERSMREHDVVECVPETRQAVVGDKSFTFDYLYDPASTQTDIYTHSVRPLVEAALSGYNATVFAYGQTGSGKTYTMGSSSWSDVPDDKLGVLPRALRHIFDECAKRERGDARASMVLRASFIEIHNEELRDLLSNARAGGAGGGGGGTSGQLTGRSRALHIREDSNGGIYVAGAEEGEVASFEDVRILLEHGTARRTVGSTEMNSCSSRSHAIFTVVLEQRVSPDLGAAEAGGWGVPDEGGIAVEEEYITSKFHFVDLAGSERLKKTKAEGERLKEGININSGLLALGNVISALGDDTRARSAQHVPYRDSKLTRMLQDSLGGNSRTLMIACVSPVDSNSEESKSTLQYANRARNIKNKPVINRDPNSRLIAQLRKEIGGLRALLQQHNITPSLSASSTTAPSVHPQDQLPHLNAVGSVGGRSGEGDEGRQEWQALLALQAQLIDHFKRAMAEIYTSTVSLTDQIQGLTAMQGLVESIQETEDKCRTKVVVHAASMPQGHGGLACHTKADEGGGVVLGGEGPTMLGRIAAGHATPGAAEAEAQRVRQLVGGAGAVPRLALESFVAGAPSPQDSLNVTGEDGDDGKVDMQAMQVLPDGAHQGDVPDSFHLDAVLIEKERLLTELVRNQRDFDTMRNTYERKMEDLQLSIRAIEEERDQTVKELESLEQRPSTSRTSSGGASLLEQGHKTSEEKERQRQRLRQLEDELKKLRKKVKDHERLLSFKEQGDQKIAKLSEEVQQLKNTRMHLHKKMAREAKGFREHKLELQKQIVTLRKADSASRKMIRQLETKLSSKDRAQHLQRRKAQIALEKKKLTAESDKAALAPVASSNPLDHHGNVVDWFLSQVSAAGGQDAAKKRHEDALALRAELQRQTLEVKAKMAAAQGVAPEAAPDSGQAVAVQELRDELEYLEAEIEFRSIEADKASRQMKSGSSAADDVADGLAQLPDLELRRLANACYDECVQQRISAQKTADKLQESEVSLLEAQRALHEARVQTQALCEAHDSEKTRIQHEYEEKLAFIIEQLQEEQANNQTQTQGITPRERANKLIASPMHKAMPSRQALDPGQQARGCELEGKAAGLIRGDGDDGDETSAASAAGVRSGQLPSPPSGNWSRRNTVSVLPQFPTAQGEALVQQQHDELHQQQARAVDQRRRVPALPITGMQGEDPDAGASTSAIRTGSNSAREPSGRRDVRDKADGPRTARGQASHVSSVQKIVIEKADRILAEKTRFVSRESGQGPSLSSTTASGRRPSDASPRLFSGAAGGVDSALATGSAGVAGSGGVGVVKLDLEKLRATGEKSHAGRSNSPARAGGHRGGWGRERERRKGAGAVAETGGMQSELDFVMDVLGGIDRHGDRRVGGGFDARGKGDRRARVEEIKDKLNAVWEALSVSDDHRSKFRNIVNAMSSKAEVALQAYEDEYARHLKLVSKSVENARKGIERGWEEIGITAEAEERRDFEFKFQAFLAPDHELDALNLVRSELVLVQHRAENTKSIQKSLSKRLEILRRLTEAAKDAAVATSAQHHDGLRKMVRDYPKIVERLKTQIIKWQASENRIWMLGQVAALDVLEHGDEDVVYRAMHTKLMNGLHKPSSRQERSVSSGSSQAKRDAGHVGAPHPTEVESGEGTPGDVSSGDAHLLRSAVTLDAGGEEECGRSSPFESKVNTSSAAEGALHVRKSTTSAMAIRFEALKQTYAQVRSRTSCLGRGDAGGRQELMRRVLEDRGLLSQSSPEARPREGDAESGDENALDRAHSSSPSPQKVVGAWTDGNEGGEGESSAVTTGASAWLDSQRFQT